MDEIKIVKSIGALSDPKDGWQKEINLVYDDKGELAFDLREWRLDHFAYREGVSLSEGEALQLLVKLGECFQVDVGDLGTKQIVMPIDQETETGGEAKPDVQFVLKDKGIAFIDKREHGGALWVIGGHELDDLMAELKSMGFKFYFSEKGGRVSKGAAAWFCK